jgi:HAD superfamily hydrolase (TIGR01509 family)
MSDTELDRALGGADFPQGLKGLVFDIDGVIFDSRDSNMAFYNNVRKAVGLGNLTREEEDYCHMASVVESFERIIPEPLRAKAYEACQDINYMRDILPMIKPEPGLRELLDWLGQYGMRSAIFTNRSSSVDEVLGYFHLEGFFSPIKTAGVTKPKPQPDGLLEIAQAWGASPNQLAFVGDSLVDQLAAKAAGVPFVAFRNPDLTAQLHASSFPALIRSLRPLVEAG